MSDNTCTLVGNCSRPPELRYTSGGRGVATFGLAVNRRWQNKTTNEWDEQTSFFNVTCWGTLGENAAASVTKGQRLIVYGRLEQRSWETEDGSKRTVIEVIADEVGPSLRWAQAQVERTDRTTTRRADDGYEQTSSQSSGQGGGGGGGGAPYEEEPFLRDAQPWEV